MLKPLFHSLKTYIHSSWNLISIHSFKHFETIHIYIHSFIYLRKAHRKFWGPPHFFSWGQVSRDARAYLISTLVSPRPCTRRILPPVCFNPDIHTTTLLYSFHWFICPLIYVHLFSSLSRLVCLKTLYYAITFNTFIR